MKLFFWGVLWSVLWLSFGSLVVNVVEKISMGTSSHMVLSVLMDWVSALMFKLVVIFLVELMM